jgi:hypothetical protein
LNRKILASAITDALQPGPWVKKKDHWFLDREDLISVVNLQKSDYGGEFYINIGVFIRPDAKALDKFPHIGPLSERKHDISQYYNYSTEYPLGKYPKENHCDVRVRLDVLVPNRESLMSALNLEDLSFTDKQRVITITHAVRDYALPFFSKVDSVDALHAYYYNDMPAALYSWIPIKVKEFLEGGASKSGA